MYSWAAPLERQEVQHVVPNVMLYPPDTLAAIVTPVAFAADGGQRWHVAHLLQLTNKGLRIERGSGIVHIQVASSFS